MSTIHASIRRALVIAVALGAWVPSPATAGGPVNAERIRSNLDTPGWSGALGVSFGLSKGNVDRLDVSDTGSLQYQTVHPPGAGWGRRPPPPGAVPFFRHRFIVTASNNFARVAGNNIVNSGFAHARYTFMALPRFGPEAFAQVQFNEFRLLRARVLGGGGPRLVLVHREVFRMWGASGYMSEYELNATVPGDPHPSEIINHRWTSYLVARAMLAGGRVMLQNTIYVQPRFDAFRDVRVLEGAQLQGQVTSIFSMGIDFELQYDSRPPQTVKPTDLTISSFLKVGFG